MNNNTPNLIESNNLASYIAAGGLPESTNNQRIIGQLVSREVLYCVSGLVDALLRKGEDVGDTSIDYLVDLCRNYTSYEVAAREEGWEPLKEIAESRLPMIFEFLEVEASSGEDARATLETKHGIRFVQNHGAENPVDTSAADDWSDLCSDESIDAEDHQFEIYEHWIISSWAQQQLEFMGEVTGDIEGMLVWGRSTTGQAIHLDRVWQKLAARFGILEGQKHGWSKQP